jgi:hypothetical protein
MTIPGGEMPDQDGIFWATPANRFHRFFQVNSDHTLSMTASTMICISHSR